MADARETKPCAMMEPSGERGSDADTRLMVTGATRSDLTASGRSKARRCKVAGDHVGVPTNALMTARAFARPPVDVGGAIEAGEGGPTACSLEVAW